MYIRALDLGTYIGTFGIDAKFNVYLCAPHFMAAFRCRFFSSE